MNRWRRGDRNGGMKGFKEFMGKAAILVCAIFGISLGKACVERSRPERPEVTREERVKLFRQSLDKRAKTKEEPRKYPRALPGGGLDWTGVEGGPKEF